MKLLKPFTILVAILITTSIFAVSPAPDGGYPAGNTAEGDNSLLNLTSGDSNTAMGNSALATLQTGSANAAFGNGALSLSTGSFNTAFGSAAMNNNTTGENNTAVGYEALQLNVQGGANTALGFRGGYAITGSNNIDIGYEQRGVAGESNTTRIGVEGTQTTVFIAGINGNSTLTNPLPVVIDINGQLGTGTPVTGFPQGGILLLQQTAPIPAGFTKIGTFKFKYDNLSGVAVTITLDVYQKN